MNKKNDNSYKLSYESDGIIGKDKNIKKPKKQSGEIFFNNTQNSE